MKSLAGIILAVLFSFSVGVQADNFEIKYCKDLTKEDFNSAARLSFLKRKYQIEKNTPTSLVGAQRGRKVEIAMPDSGHIVIAWVTGFGYTRDDWLVNLKRDMLWELSGDAEQGKLSVNWCKDLTVEDFHAVAVWALEKRKFEIEEDTPSSLTGAQRGKKVEISMADPGHIVIRWVPGFGHGTDKWLNHLYQEVTWRLAE
jgi:hypothetical protein